MLREGLTEITGDLFDVTNRIKEIDHRYFLVRNERKGCYEVHHRGQYQTTRALTVPYDALDARTVELVRMTRMERLDQLLSGKEALVEYL